MARIAGVDIPKDKKVAYSLRYVHGIGLKTALDICEQAKVDPNTRVTDLSSKQEDEIRKVIADLKLLIEGELRSENLKNVKFNPKQKVMRKYNNPLSLDGGVVGLKGNLAPDGAIVKIAGLKKLQFTGRARCFDTEEAAYKAVQKKNIKTVI